MEEDLSSAVSAAVAEASTEVTGSPTPEPAETPEPSPAPEPEAEAAPEPAKAAKASPEPADDEPEFLAPTSEELAAIEASPELKKVYRSLQKGFTKKTQELAGKRKELEQSAQVVDWIRSDPESAVRTIAKAANITLGEARQVVADTQRPSAVDELTEKWSTAVGPEAANILRPLFEDTARTLLEKEMAPITAANAELANATNHRNAAATIREFGAVVTERGEEWDDDIQTEMAQIANSIEPGPNVSMGDFISTVYDTALARRMRTTSARANLERLRRVRREVEPSNTSRPTPQIKDIITNDMSDKDAVAIAVRQAKQSLNLR